MEDGALGNLAAAGDREESASHHFSSCFYEFREICRCAMCCAHPRNLGLIQSERATKIMGVRIENDWNHALDRKLSLVKEVTGVDCGR